jgi:hypothetical protein
MSKLHFKDGVPDLELAMEALRIESEYISNTLDAFKNVLPGLSVKLSNLLKSSPDEELSTCVQSTKAAYKELDPKLTLADFMTYRKTLVSVPEGFEGNMLDYIKFLNELTANVYPEAKKIMKAYNLLLSTFITNKDSKVSIKDDTGFFKDIEKHRNQITRKLGEYFPSNSSTSKAYLGNVIDRFRDIDSLVVEVEKLDRRYVSENIGELNKQVQESVDLLNLVIADINKGGIDKVSGNASMNVSKGAYEVAKYIEFVSIFRYKTLQAMGAVENTVVQLNSVIG